MLYAVYSFCFEALLLGKLNEGDNSIMPDKTQKIKLLLRYFIFELPFVGDVFLSKILGD